MREERRSQPTPYRESIAYQWAIEDVLAHWCPGYAPTYFVDVDLDQPHAIEGPDGSQGTEASKDSQPPPGIPVARHLHRARRNGRLRAGNATPRIVLSAVYSAVAALGRRE